MPSKHSTPTSELRLHFTNGHSHTIHTATDQQIEALLHVKYKEKIEEFLEAIHFLTTAPYTFPSQELIAPLKNVLNYQPIVQSMHVHQYMRLEPLPYDETRGYGGMYLAFQDGGSTGYLVGDTPKVLPLCKTIYDIDEYVRLDKKWQQANFKTALIASRDEVDTHRNILIRGLRGSLNIIALIGVRLKNNQNPIIKN